MDDGGSFAWIRRDGSGPGEEEGGGLAIGRAVDHELGGADRAPARRSAPSKLMETQSHVATAQSPRRGRSVAEERRRRLTATARHGPRRFPDGARERGRARQAAFMTAPSIGTPAVRYFHNATSSLRAKATISVFLNRPPLAFTRPWNQRVNAESG